MARPGITTTPGNLAAHGDWERNCASGLEIKTPDANTNGGAVGHTFSTIYVRAKMHHIRTDEHGNGYTHVNRTSHGAFETTALSERSRKNDTNES